MNFFQYLSDNLLVSLIYIVYSFFITKYVILITVKLNIIDYPIEKRKIHSDPTPLIGFIYFLLTIFLLIIFQSIQDDLQISFIIGIVFILFFNGLIGLIDDKLSITPNSRLITIIFICLISITLSDQLSINTIRSYLLNDTIILNNSFAILFTVLCYLLLINSLNLADGINGLVIFISIIWIVLISFYATKFVLITNLFFVINLLILLFFNLQSKIFLGSGGVNFISTYISIITVYTFNSSNELKYEFIFLFFMIPGIDMIRVFLVRILKGKNPFSPDKNHFHHYLLKIYSLKKTLLIYCSLILLPGLILINFNNVVFYMIILKLIIYIYLVNKLAKR